MVRNEEPLVMSVKDAGKLLGLGRQGSYEAVHRGEIPVIHIGRRLLVPRAALMRMLEEAGHKPA
ncbi:MAG: helix-turn-helix domain-containing protein [Dehalococcoidia bacterium]|nr:helix-turn-helix domain-containing protein [Dehalococcoidia bacterium]